MERNNKPLTMALEKIQSQLTIRKNEYYAAPKICQECACVLPYEKRTYTFCSIKCRSKQVKPTFGVQRSEGVKSKIRAARLKKPKDMNVSFDFDETLDRRDIQEFAKSMQPFVTLYILTSRTNGAVKNLDVERIAAGLGIPIERIIYAYMSDKWRMLEKFGIHYHVDDDQIETEIINENLPGRGISLKDLSYLMSLPKTKDEAQTIKSMYYFTGIPCGNNHISKRITHSSNCYLCGQTAALANYYTRKINPEKNKHVIIKRIQNRAGRLHIPFDITIDDIEWVDVCPIFNIKINYTQDPELRDNWASVDRIDSEKGYIKGNVQILSNRANLAKSNLTNVEILLLYDYMVKHRI